MRTPDIILGVGDELPLVQRDVTLNGAVVNLVGYTATFTVAELTGAVVFTHAATIPDAVNGVVRYQLTGTDSAALTAGTIYSAWFTASAVTGETMTVPNDGFLSLEVFAKPVGGHWTYTGDPGARPIDAVRFLIHDTDPDNGRLSDREIEWMLTQRGGNPYYAAADACRNIAATYSATSGVSKKVGDLSLSYSSDGPASFYTKLAAQLENQGGMLTMGAPVAGGIGANYPNIFSIGMFDAPGGS